MAEYIERQAALDTFNRAVKDVGILDADDIETVFGMLSSADVAPVVHGEWLNAIFDSKRYRCSICNYHISNLVRENYCPNCGAKMDGRIMKITITEIEATAEDNV